MIGRVSGCLTKALDDMWWSGDVGVANTEADHIYSLSFFLGYFLANLHK
jgi:hypothetical protein